MLKTRVSLVALLVLAVLVSVLAGCGRKGLINVNGEKISKDEFYARLERVPIQTPQGAQPAGQYVIQQMIQEKLVQQLAKKEGVAPTEAQINKKIKLVKKNNGNDIRQVLAQQGLSEEDWKYQLTVQQALTNYVSKNAQVSDSDVRKAYDQGLNAKPSPFKRPEQIKLSAIVIADKAKADKAYAKIQGGMEFGTVAGKMSELPGADQSNGAVDWVVKNDTRFPTSITSMLFTMDIGTYSKPILVPFSIADGKNTKLEKKWVIVRADQKRPAKVQQYNEVKDLIKEQLAVRKGSTKNDFGKALQEFTKNADIKVNAERYKRIPVAMIENATKALDGKTAK